MKTLYSITLLSALCGMAHAQMPTTAPSSFDASGRSTQAQSGVVNDDPSRVGGNPAAAGFRYGAPLVGSLNGHGFL